MIAMNQVFGDFKENLPTDHEFLVIGFSPSSIPIQQRWRNNGLSADFVADYLVTFFPAFENSSSLKRQAEIKDAVNYIANELLENAMKFNDEASPYVVRFGLHLLQDAVVLLVTNSISTEELHKLKSFIEEFIVSDPDDFYVHQLEKSAEDESGQASGLGLITMKNDYAAKLGWKFETIQQEPPLVTVTTMVQLTL